MSITRTNLTAANQLAEKIASFASDKKANDITILDMREIVNYCDYFVICTGTSSRQVKAIANGIDEGLHKLGVKVRYKQGLGKGGRSKSFSPGSVEQVGTWILLDLGNVIVHVFDNEAREFYALEHLWQDAPREEHS